VRVDLDLGSQHTLRYCVWDPDLALNSDLAELGIELPTTIGAIVTHRNNGDRCEGFIYFDVPASHWFNVHSVDKAYWTVEAWDPLTLSPSLLCNCGDHGFIRQGRWVSA
jgi:hypothetical protein